jgi:hypothetical protein
VEICIDGVGWSVSLSDSELMTSWHPFLKNIIKLKCQLHGGPQSHLVSFVHQLVLL